MNFRSAFKKHFPSILWLFFCVAFLFFFISPINQLVNKLIVHRLISGFQNNLFNEFILFILSVGTTAWLFFYGEKQLLRKLSVVTICFYVLQLNQGEWLFFHLPVFTFIRCWDPPVTAFFLPGCLTLIPWISDIRATGTDKGFVEDMPIESGNQDTFRRKEVAKAIADRISLTANTQSFAIGILGEYGSGKTSFINLIKTYLDPDKSEIIPFNPWSADGTPNIQKDFFDLLASRLYAMNPQVSGLILDYSRKLSRVDSSAEKFVRQIGLAGSLFKSGSYVDDYERINRMLYSSGKKIIVTIDDLDRLYQDEVIEVLRLIRNTASFTNIFYLVAYERGYIQDSLKSMNANVGNNYLDKIIQLEIPLPKREGEDLLEVLERQLKSFITQAHLEAYQENILKKAFRNPNDFDFNYVLRQSRDVIKFINNFKIAYELLGKEVMFESLFVLELIKFRFPLIYDRLFENRKDFIRERPSRSSHEVFYDLKTYRAEQDDLLEIGQTLRQENHYSTQEIALICSLLEVLFLRKNRSSAAKNAIVYPMFFERYFRYRLSTSEISERQFQLAWQDGVSGIKRYVDFCAEEQLLGELSLRMFQEKPKTRAVYEMHIEGLFYLGWKYFQEKGRNTFDTESLIDLFYNYDHRVEKKFYKGDEKGCRGFLEGVLERAEPPYGFVSELLYDIKNTNNNTSIPTPKLVDMQVNYFSEHLKIRRMDRDAAWMFWGIRHHYTEPVADKPGQVTKHWKFEPVMIPLIKEALAAYDPYEFLKLGINYDMQTNELVAIYTEIIAIFDSPEEFRELVNNNPLLDPDIKTDYLSFFDTCKSTGFSNWTTYEFKTSLKLTREDHSE